MNKKTISVLIILNLLLVGGMGYRTWAKSTEAERKIERELDRADVEYARMGAWGRGDYTRLVRLMGSTHDSGGISDEDLAWTLDLMRVTQAKRSNSTAQFASGWIPVVWGNVTRPSPSQARSLGDAAIECLERQQAEGVEADATSLLAIVSNLKDQRALPCVRRLLGSSDRLTRAWALRTMKALGRPLPERTPSTPRKAP